MEPKPIDNPQPETLESSMKKFLQHIQAKQQLRSTWEPQEKQASAARPLGVCGKVCGRWFSCFEVRTRSPIRSATWQTDRFLRSWVLIVRRARYLRACLSEQIEEKKNGQLPQPTRKERKGRRRTGG